MVILPPGRSDQTVPSVRGMKFKVLFLEVEEGVGAAGEGGGVGVVKKEEEKGKEKGEEKGEGKGEVYHSSHSAEALTGRVKKGEAPLEICPLEVFCRGKGCRGVTLREVLTPVGGIL
jgi:hypothetical protein